MLSDEELTRMREDDSARQGRWLNAGEADRHKLLKHIDRLVLKLDSDRSAFMAEIDFLRSERLSLTAERDTALSKLDEERQMCVEAQNKTIEHRRALEGALSRLGRVEKLVARWENDADSPDAPGTVDLVYRRLTERRHAEELREALCAPAVERREPLIVSQKLEVLKPNPSE